jgi:hypothetical protein
MNIFCVSPALAALNVGDPDLRMEHMRAFGDLIEGGMIIAVYEPHDRFAGFVDNAAGLPMLAPARA